MVSIPACHAGDPGSIPGRGAFFHLRTNFNENDDNLIDNQNLFQATVWQLFNHWKSTIFELSPDPEICVLVREHMNLL